MDKRILMTTGLALVFILAWQFLFQPLFFPAKPPPPPVEAPAGSPSAKPEPAPPPPAGPDHPEAPPLVLESAHVRATLTNKGAGIREFALKTEEAKGDVVLLAPHEGAAPHFAFRHYEGGGEKIDTAGWEVVESTPQSATFRIRLASGVELRKTFTLAADAPRLDVSLTLANVAAPPEDGKPAAPARIALELVALNGLMHDSEYRFEQYAAGVARVEKRVKFWPLPQVLAGEEQIDAMRSAVTAKERQEAYQEAADNLSQGGAHKTWFGLKNRFFAAAVAPDEATRTRIESYWFRGVPRTLLPAYGGEQAILAFAKFDPVDVGAKPETWTFALHAAPLRKAALSALPGGEELLNYGGGCVSGCGPISPIFAPMAALINLVAPLILVVLSFLADVFRNHGVAIIFTTLIIRLCLFPLSKKSQVSMYRMQQLGPKITALRERYKDDQQKFGMEQMRLFREHKINPLSGCLPMLLQMPIFIAMYSVFEMSVELRRRPFALWISDLSQPDYLLGPYAGWTVPLFGLTIDGLNLLPIVMTITWFLQSWYAPRSPDPQMAAQQKMMLAMPVVFGLMCYNLASGLSLYFLVNSLLSMSEQKLIKKFFLKPPPDAAKTA